MTISAASDLGAPSPSLLGYVDIFDGPAVCGWAALPSGEDGLPGGALELEAIHDGHVFARVLADTPRPDVAAAIGGDGRYGFSIPLPRQLLDGGSYTMEIRCAANGAPLTGGAFAVRAADGAADSAYATCRVDFLADPFAFLGDVAGKTQVARNIAHLGVEDLGLLYPNYAASRPPLAVSRFSDQQPAFQPQLEALYAAIDATQASGSGSRIVALRDVYAFNNRLHAVAGDGDVVTIYETARPPDRPYTAQPFWTANRLRSAAYSVGLAEPLLYLGSPGFANYGHWLVDDLPRAEAVAPIARREAAPVTAIVPGAGSRLDDVKNQSLSALFGGAMRDGIVFIPPDQVVHFPRLYYVTPHSFHPTLKSPDACRALRARAEQHLASGDGVRRLFVSRDPQNRRQIVNGAEVMAALRHLGFWPVDPGQMSFSEQVAAFSRADTVVGLMGAAMTNTLFCKPGARLLYLAPSGWVEPFYWDLAAVCGHRYGAFYGDTQPGADAPHRADFVVPVDQLLAVVAALLGLD